MKKKKIILIIIILILFTVIWGIPNIVISIMSKNVLKQANLNEENIEEKVVYNIIDLYKVLIQETNSNIIETIVADNNSVTYNKKCEIDFTIPNFNSENKYRIEIYLNDKLYSKNEMDTETYNTEIELKEEGKNNIKTEFYINDITQNISENIIYYVKPYKKQFLDEFSNKGVIVHYLNGSWEKYEKTSDLLINSGLKNIRTTFSWQDIENGKTSEKYDFSYYDKWIEKLTNNDINIIACFNRFSVHSGEDRIVNTEEEIDRFLKFANTVIDRYPQIYEYELFNEANINDLYLTEESVNWYAKILEELSKNKKIELITSGTSTPDVDSEDRITSQKFYQYLFDNGVYDYTNNFAFHPYDSYDEKKLNERLYMKMDIHKEIFINEGGFSRQYVTEYGIHFTDLNKQADRIIQQTIILDNYNVEKSIIYNLWSPGTDNTNVENNYGLITNDYLPKESYYAVKNYSENTNGGEYIGTINLANGLEAHVYDKDGKPKIITWSNTKDQTIQIDYADFTAKDLYGNDIENTNGKLDITTSPVYLDNISTKYFYEAISNTALENYSEFEEKFATEIASVDGLQENIDTLKQYLKSISNIENESEEIAKQKMKEHFDLGNQILTSYTEKELDVEYVKLSSMLDMLNEIGDSFEDLVTVTAKTRNPDLENTKTLIDNAEQAINNNNDLDIVYPEKILEFSKDLYEDSEYINNLEEENDIKTGLIVSYDLHAKYLADWANVFTNLYIDKYIEENPVTVSYSATSLTNQDVTVTLNITQDVKITNNEGSNTYTFTENGTFTFEYERRGKTDSKLVSVNYIDKTSPEITNVENGEAYTQSVSPNVSDEHLDKVQLTFKGQVIEGYEIGDELTEEGEYKLTATDTVGNTSTVKFYIMKEDSTFKISNSYILNINPETTTKSFMENFTIIEGYKIKNEDTELGEEDKISTGDILEDEDGTKFILVVKGDLNRDGRLSIVDLSIGRKYLLGIIDIDEVQKLSSDMNTDEETSLTDLSIMRKTILGIIK